MNGQGRFSQLPLGSHCLWRGRDIMMGSKYDRAQDEGKVHKVRLPTPATEVSELAFATAAIRSAPPFFFYTAGLHRRVVQHA